MGELLEFSVRFLLYHTHLGKASDGCPLSQVKVGSIYCPGMKYNRGYDRRHILSTYLRRHIAIPTDHGSWVFIISPLLIGLFAGGSLTTASFYLVIGVMAAFLIRQPVTIAFKAYSGRRWTRSAGCLAVDAGLRLIALLAVAGLVSQGFAVLLLLALPGIPVFVWHLYLVSRRTERRQVGVEVVGCGVLALAAPAAYWVGVSSPDPFGWWLFLLTWFQSAASIVYAYLRLEQRELKTAPAVPGCAWRAAPCSTPASTCWQC